MIPATHKSKWEAFLAAHPDRKPETISHKEIGGRVVDKGPIAMHRHAFNNPGQTYDEQQWALMVWQMAIMDEAGWHSLDRPKLPIVPQPPDDPALFQF